MSWDGALIQYDWGPYKKEEIRIQTCTEGRPHEDRARRPPYTSQGEGPQMKSTLGLPASRTVRGGFCCLSPQSVVLCYGSPTGQIHQVRLRGACLQGLALSKHPTGGLSKASVSQQCQHWRVRIPGSRPLNSSSDSQSL